MHAQSNTATLLPFSGSEHSAIAHQNSGAPADATTTRALRYCIVFILVATTVLARFGLDLGGYALSFSAIAIYGLVAVLALSGRAVIDTLGLLLYGAAMLVAYVSWFVNTSFSAIDRSSPASMMLLIALYLPFVVTAQLSGQHRFDWRWTIRAFSNIAFICALAGIAQFFVQFVFNPPWLFDFTAYIPESLRGPGLYNTVISVGEFNKSNGFVLREPSSFSFLMALATLVELSTSKRWMRIGVLVFALLLTYSGTGLLALILGLCFPLSHKSAARLIALAIIGSVLVVLLGETLNLSFTLNRIQEFGSEHSSAYIRYIAPMHVIADSIDSDPWTALIGHGPGSIQRTSQSIVAFDPTWAKLIFEYGLLGCGALVALVIHALVRSGVPSQLRAVLFFSWFIMGGHLLSPDNVSVLYVLACVWRPYGQTGCSAMRSTTEPRAVR